LLSHDERRRRLLELVHRNESAVETLLRPEQVTRLRQLALQGEGPRAFREPEVAAVLKLTLSQRERLHDIEAEMLFGKGDGSRPPEKGMAFGKGDRHGPGHPPRGPSPQALRTAIKQMEELLTPEQAQRWKELTGEPFQGDVSSLQPCPDGPRDSPGRSGPHLGPPGSKGRR
jgi:hypothetical protein